MRLEFLEIRPYLFQNLYLPFLTTFVQSIYIDQAGATNMAFALHVNMERCTGCNNCVVACPVNALELYTSNPASTEKIYKVINGEALILDIKHELCAGCGICVDACPYDVIQLSGQAPQAVSA